MSRFPVGQPVEACPTTDKWTLLTALTEGAEAFGLGHRSLGVLRALLTFFPDRDLPPDHGAGIVYPSNRTLSSRLNGMPESTLRRHLATLIKSGLIARQDSANRKRFARFGGVAFGFDLSPLARMASAIVQAAADARLRRDRVEALRARIAASRQRLIEDGTADLDDPLIEECRLILRRKVGPEVLEALAIALAKRQQTGPDYRAQTQEPSATNSQNERHIQKTDKSVSVSPGSTATQSPNLGEVLGACTEFQSLFPERCHDWDGLTRIADRLYPMMGITQEVYEKARATLGGRAAATAILCMLETMAEIRCPGAYLRALTNRAMRNTFSLSTMLSRARAAKLSADNRVPVPA